MTIQTLNFYSVKSCVSSLDPTLKNKQYETYKFLSANPVEEE
jgi:hypothetical protein